MEITAIASFCDKSIELRLAAVRGGEDVDCSRHTDVLLMAENANYSAFPSNSDDIDWNWTVPAATTNESNVIPALSAGWRVSVVAAMSFLIAAGMLLNLTTVVTLLQARLTALRVNVLALNLACCDLLRSTVAAPLFLLSVVSRQWPSGLLGCRWYLALSILFGTASLNTVTAIAIDRQVIFVYDVFSFCFKMFLKKLKVRTFIIYRRL